MDRARRTVALAALLGMLALTAGIAATLPPPCCPANCDRCPLTICAVAAVESPHGPSVSAAAPSLPNTVNFYEAHVTVLTAWAASVPRLLAHEFRRPLRI
jgi:hypothetical protein